MHHVRYFLTVADTLNFTRVASNATYRSRPLSPAVLEFIRAICAHDWANENAARDPN